MNTVVSLSIPVSLLERLDAHRRDARPAPSRSAIIQAALEDYLATRDRNAPTGRVEY